ncbi:MAG: hypothetical protein ACFB10_19745 [Salibacteraceae bacterium]
MNFKFALALLCLVMSFASLSAQNFDIDWGEEFDSKTEVQKILGYSGDKMVVYSIKGKKRYFGTYSSEGFEQLSFNEFELPKINGKKTGLLNLALTGGEVSAVIYVYEKSTKAFTLFVQRFNLKGGLDGQARKIYASEGSKSRSKNMKVEMVFSPNQNMALVYFDRENKDRTECFSDVVVMDISGDKLEKVSESTHQFAIKDYRSEQIRYRLHHAVEDDGTFSIIREKARFVPTVKASFVLSVGRYDQSGAEIGVVDLEKDDLALLTPTLIVQDNKVVVVGYYLNEASKKSTVVGYSGLFYAEMSLEMELKAIKVNPFSDEFMKNIFSERRVENARAKDRDLFVPEAYTMRKIIVHADGTLTVLSEFYMVTVTTSNGSKITTTNYGPILFFKLDNDGKLTGGDAIKKSQVSSAVAPAIGFNGAISVFVSVEFPDKLRKYWSFASMADNGNVYILFNDHFKNALDDQGEVSKNMKNPKQSVPYLVTIYPNGTFKKRAMVNSGDSETYTVPQVTYRNSEVGFIIWGIWRKMNKFGQAKIGR